MATKCARDQSSGLEVQKGNTKQYEKQEVSDSEHELFKYLTDS